MTTTNPTAMPVAVSALIPPAKGVGMPLNVTAGLAATEPFYLVGSPLQPPTSAAHLPDAAAAVEALRAKRPDMSEVDATRIVRSLTVAAETIGMALASGVPA